MIRLYIGPSASGKDFFMRKDAGEGYKKIVSYTTRPMRPGEKDGIDYFFVKGNTTAEKNLEFEKMIEQGLLLEYRKYDTIENGEPAVWYYGTPKLNDFDATDYVGVVDIQGAKDHIESYGPENIDIIFVETDPELRKTRSMKRGGFDEDEWNRRAADDEIKFSDKEIDELCRLCGGAITVIRNNFEYDNVMRYTRYAKEYDDILAAELEQIFR